MKKRLKIAVALLAVCLLMLGISLPVSASGAGEALVVAVGFGEAELPAERFALQIELSDHGRNIEQATEANDIRLARLRERLAPFGTLTECGFYTQESYSGSRLCVTRCLRLEGACESLSPELFAILHACGVSAVCEPEFFSAPEALAPARAQALQAALADALAHAAALGGSDTVLEIEEQCGFCNGYARAGEGSTASVHLGASVRVTVKKA